ncbi:MAG: calcium/sodium antiporter [Pseudomonadota bacterium]
MILILMLLAGFALLLLGGEALVRGSVDAASRLGVSKLIIGITLVGFGTSMPEMVTSIQAVYAGSPGIAIGNFVGSNIANILLVLGLSALVATVPVGKSVVARDGYMVLAVTIMFIVMCLTVPFNRAVGLVFLAILTAYLIYAVRQDRKSMALAGETDGENGQDDGVWPVAYAILIAIIGMAMVIGGGHILVIAAIDLAKVMGVPEHVIGLTIVAVGTSLPELATFLISAARGESEIGVGNLLGSNLFNLLAIGGMTATLAPAAIPVPWHIAYVDNLVMLGATLALLAFAWKGNLITRWEGALLLTAYVIYLTTLYATGSGPA